jgi:lipoprotein-anchoring transpeptidase ErfK/SrfK
VHNPAIYIYKEKRRLYVVESNVIVRDYPITLGSHPVGDKKAAGDGRTPEGNFYVCGKTDSGRFKRALTIDYPDKGHARRALSAGLITPVQFDKILLALESRTDPPWDTALGGQISIHDTEDGLERAAHGGIELYGSDMQELFKIASLGTPVHIRP